MSLTNRGYSSTSLSLAAIFTLCHSHPSPKALSIHFRIACHKPQLTTYLSATIQQNTCCSVFTHDPAPLNNSDHLPITATLQFSHSTAIPQEQLTNNKIHRAKALKGTHLRGYQMSVSSFVAPLIGLSHSSAEEINDEITNISGKICSAALQSLPLRKCSVKKKKWYKDQTLSRLASAKKAAWDKWSANGRPKEGPLYDAKIKTRAEFRKRMRVCAANSERKRIQRFDDKFKQKSSSRFRIPSTKTRQSPSLRVNQEVATYPKTILAAWEDHFRAISSANTELSSVMCSSEQEINKMMHDSFNNEDYLLDVPFTSEEVDSVLKKLKLGKAAGHDGVQGEHLKYGGLILRDWILQICNAITELEHVPDSLKIGIIHRCIKEEVRILFIHTVTEESRLHQCLPKFWSHSY